MSGPPPRSGAAAGGHVPLHPALEPVAWLFGRFVGTGHGDYPTIDPFEYREEVTVTHAGTPVASYRQRTWHPVTGSPMHGEVGYLRLPGSGRIELVVAHTFGIVEVQEGTVEATRLEVGSRGLLGSSTAKQVSRVRRSWVLEDDTLRTDLWMAYAEVPETHHLAATLVRRPLDDTEEQR